MSTKAWPIEATALLLAHIDHSLAKGQQWKDTVVDTMSGLPNKTIKSCSQKLGSMDKLYPKKDTKTEIAKHGSAYLDLDDEMADAIDAARKLIEQGGSPSIALTSKEVEKAVVSSRKRSRTDDDDDEVRAKRQKLAEPAPARKLRPLRPTPATRSATAKVTVQVASTEDTAQPAPAEKAKCKGRAQPLAAATLPAALPPPEDGGVHPALAMLDEFHPRMRDLLFQLLQEGQAPATKRVAGLEADLAAARAREAALEAELVSTRGEIAQLKRDSGAPASAAALPDETMDDDTTGGVASPVVVKTSGERESPLLSVAPSRLSDTDGDLEIEEVVAGDPQATPGRPRGDVVDEFGPYFQGPTPNATKFTQVGGSSPVRSQAAAAAATAEKEDETVGEKEDEVDWDPTHLGLEEE
ncbi:hypothetical protein K458DRAFT_453274 [Lentithecium fluviatile CBS 122367]|uniref:Uncharacterized protein n=1 Tax=Lentithecium fluviatile CBS 122367 TaxID=1168545 RepID=A0A6G1IYL0_9PLEO|nr:hypothetical protein K458DRAFT_453274 [Lentithecium fluviatile CBS 122367]